jgi:hypothetical protein
VFTLPGFLVPRRPNYNTAMSYSLRTLLIGQFGLRSLFAITTLAAIAFAIIRLPILPVIRLTLLLTLWAIFRVLLQATRKQPATPAARVNDAVLEIVSQMFFPVFLGWEILTSPHGSLAMRFSLIGLLALIPAGFIVRAIIVIRSELRRTSAAADAKLL